MAPVSFLVLGFVDYYIRWKEVNPELLEVGESVVTSNDFHEKLWPLVDIFMVLAVVFLIIFILATILRKIGMETIGKPVKISDEIKIE